LDCAKLDQEQLLQCRSISGRRGLVELSTHLGTIGDWPGTIAAMVVRSLRSKMCLSPFVRVLGKALRTFLGR
jgi:hypothetical protein